VRSPSCSRRIGVVCLQNNISDPLLTLVCFSRDVNEPERHILVIILNQLLLLRFEVQYAADIRVLGAHVLHHPLRMRFGGVFSSEDRFVGRHGVFSRDGLSCNSVFNSLAELEI